MNERLKKIVLVEDWSVMRKFIEEILKKVVGYELYMVLSDIKSVEKYIEGRTIDLLIMNIPLYREDEALDITNRIRRSSPSTRIVLTTMTYSDKLYEKAKAAGANGVWQKEISETSFIKACAFL